MTPLIPCFLPPPNGDAQVVCETQIADYLNHLCSMIAKETNQTVHQQWAATSFNKVLPGSPNNCKPDVMLSPLKVDIHHWHQVDCIAQTLACVQVSTKIQKTAVTKVFLHVYRTAHSPLHHQCLDSGCNSLCGILRLLWTSNYIIPVHRAPHVCAPDCRSYVWLRTTLGLRSNSIVTRWLCDGSPHQWEAVST